MHTKKRNDKSKKIIFICVAVILLTIGVVANIWASLNYLTVNHFTYVSDKLSSDQGIRVVVLADLHDHGIGTDNQKLVEKVRAQEPELILMIGDFVNDTSEDAFDVCELIEEIKDIAPVYFALGNHELGYMKQHPELVAELETAGAEVLDKEYVDIEISGTKIRLGGMYDYAFGLNGKDEAAAAPEDVKRFLEEYQDTDRLKLMMTHLPDSFIFGDAASYWDVDFVLSGHLHGGQVVVPFFGGLYGGDQGWFPEYVHGMYEKENIQLFVTSGLGSNWKALPRFNNLPEIAVVEIQGAKD